jgi:flagellar motor switch protein FliM
MINDRFARLLRMGLFNMVRRTPEISVAPIQVLKFSEYVHTLHVPASLNLVKLAPLRGTALFVLDAKLVFTLVDNFFGGNGRHAKIEGRDFTGTEGRIIQIVLRPELRDEPAVREHCEPYRDCCDHLLSHRARGRWRGAACNHAVLDDRAHS